MMLPEVQELDRNADNVAFSLFIENGLLISDKVGGAGWLQNRQSMSLFFSKTAIAQPFLVLGHKFDYEPWFVFSELTDDQEYERCENIGSLKFIRKSVF